MLTGTVVYNPLFVGAAHPVRTTAPLYAAYLYFVWLYLWSHRSRDKDGHMGFFRDAFGSAAQRSAEATAALRYVRDVFGAPGVRFRVRAAYLVSCCLAYVAYAGYILTGAVFASWPQAPHRSAWEVFAGLYLLGAVSFVWCTGMQLWWWRRFGSAQRRHTAWLRQREGCLHLSPAKDTKTPWWWLYATSFVVTAENWPAFMRRTGLVIFNLVVLLLMAFQWLHVPGTWGVVVGWSLAVLWLAVGWLLPLDGLIKLAPWDGPGDFAVMVLRANRAD